MWSAIEQHFSVWGHGGMVGRLRDNWHKEINFFLRDL